MDLLLLGDKKAFDSREHATILNLIASGMEEHLEALFQARKYELLQVGLADAEDEGFDLDEAWCEEEEAEAGDWSAEFYFLKNHVTLRWSYVLGASEFEDGKLTFCVEIA